MYKKNKIYIGLLLVLILTLFACTSKEDIKEEGMLNVVATTTIVGDLVDEIARDKVNLTVLIPEGVDPHSYQASAGDVSKMEAADIVIYNGLHLEGKMEEIFRNLDKKNKATIEIAKGLDQDDLIKTGDDGHGYDPHIWFNTSNWEKIIAYTSEELSNIDRENESFYKENRDLYLEKLKELDTYIGDRISEIPENKRVLITTHDTFNYLAKEYGFEIMSLQGVSTDMETSTGDIMNIAKYIVENEIPTIYLEVSTPPKSIEALQDAVKAQGYDVKIGGELYTDSLIVDDKEGNNYINTFKYNVDTILKGLK